MVRKKAAGMVHARLAKCGRTAARRAGMPGPWLHRQNGLYPQVCEPTDGVCSVWQQGEAMARVANVEHGVDGGETSQPVPYKRPRDGSKLDMAHASATIVRRTRSAWHRQASARTEARGDPVGQPADAQMRPGGARNEMMRDAEAIHKMLRTV